VLGESFWQHLGNTTENSFTKTTALVTCCVLIDASHQSNKEQGINQQNKEMEVFEGQGHFKASVAQSPKNIITKLLCKRNYNSLLLFFLKSTNK
jgi:hypothetical protein